MGFFSKRNDKRADADQAERIADFWSWWAEEGKARAAAAFDPDVPEADPQAFGEAISPYVTALGLGFETGPGTQSRHLLVFTPLGNPDLLAVADRWLAAAPPADADFEYDNRRHAVPDPSGFAIGIGEDSVDFASARVAASPGDGRVNLHVMHDNFEGAEEAFMGQVTFIMLDAVLGERVVEDRIGAVTYGSDHRDGERPLLELPSLLQG